MCEHVCTYTSLFLNFSCFICVDGLSVCMSVIHMYSVARVFRMGCWSFGSGVIDIFELLCEYEEPNPCRTAEQSVILMDEPSPISLRFLIRNAKVSQHWEKSKNKGKLRSVSYLPLLPKEKLGSLATWGQPIVYLSTLLFINMSSYFSFVAKK